MSDNLESLARKPESDAWGTLQPEHIMKVLRSISPQLRRFLAQRHYIIFLAGGFIRATIAGEEASDIDLFSVGGQSWHDAEDLARALQRKVTNTENARTISEEGKMPIQFITRWQFDAVEDLLGSFDYTIAQAAIWHENGVWKSCCSSRFYADLASKSLTYLAPDRKEDAGGSLLRAVRFLRKGYSISPEDLSAVVARLITTMQSRNADIAAASTSLRALGETNVATYLARELRSVDPLTIVDGVPEATVARFERTNDGLVERLEDEDRANRGDVEF